MLHKMVVTGNWQDIIIGFEKGCLVVEGLTDLREVEEAGGAKRKEHPTVKRQHGQGRKHGRHPQLRFPIAPTMQRLKCTRSK